MAADVSEAPANASQGGGAPQEQPMAQSVAETAAPPTSAPQPLPGTNRSDRPSRAPEPAAATTAQNLGELWQQVLAGLELPSTRMLLSQQAHLDRLDERRAVVRVSGNWIAMVQSRLPLLEAAMARALGSPRQVTLEAGETARPLEPPASAAPEPPPIVAMAMAPASPAGSAPSVMISAAESASEPMAMHPAAGQEVGADPRSAAETGPALAQPFSGPAEPRTPPFAVSGPQPIHEPSRLDQKARQLADFFNGDVIDNVTGP